MLPIGELVPRLPLDPDRSWSENEDVRVEDLPLLSDLESLECEYEPVVVDPLCDERWGERPRLELVASGGDR